MKPPAARDPSVVPIATFGLGLLVGLGVATILGASSVRRHRALRRRARRMVRSMRQRYRPYDDWRRPGPWGPSTGI